jgi:hypothetical protein
MRKAKQHGHARTPRKIAQRTFLDPAYEHIAGVTGLTAIWGPEGPVGAIVAAQCSGRIGWDYKQSTHEFLELYRGQDEAEAERLCREHNEQVHGRSNVPPVKSEVSETRDTP